MLPPLYPHQFEAIRRGEAAGSLAIFHEPGLGKTRTTLEIFRQLRQEIPLLKLLIVCPLSIIDAAWGADIQTFTTLRWCLLKRYDRTASVFLINYELLIRSTGVRLLQVSGVLLHPLMLVIDESSRLRDPRSLTTKMILTLAERCQYRFVLSGTPTPNGLHEIHAQIRVVDPDCLPRSFYTFRRTYFYLGRGSKMLSDAPPNRAAMQELFRQGWEWKITDEKRDQLLARIAPICSWVRKSDALQLPERITTIRHVTLSPQEQRAYDQMKQQLVVEFERETVTAEIALTRLQKLQQIANGWVYGETTHRIGTSRLTVLLETLEELGPQPVLIFAMYRESIAQIAEALGDRAVTLYAETKDRNESLRRFGAEAQYLVAHPLSAAHGLSLTQSSTVIWYSLPWSLEQYVQGCDRVHRIGQTRPVLYVHLIAPGTIDEDIWAVLQQKKTLQEAIDAVLGKRRETRCELAASLSS